MRDAPRLTLAQAKDHVETCVFGTSGSPLPESRARHAVGVELEWLSFVGAAQARLTPDGFDRLGAAVGPLPGGGRLTLEPGGQLELSSAPADDVHAAIEAVAQDVFTVDRACAARGIDLVALGLDPLRPPERVLHADRYAAMEAHFDADGPAGRTMMDNTASIQVNVGLGPAAGVAARWRLANALTPTLVAMFANSPLAAGTATGWLSARQQAWATLDRTRAAAPRVDGHPVTDWVDYAFAAQVFCHPVSGTLVPLETPMTFGEWLHRGGDDAPTLEDFTYHLTTLFPPVRPRGWFEVRVLDALPTPFWQLATLVVHTVLTDDAVGAAARRAVAGTDGLSVEAARMGLTHPQLAEAATSVVALVLEALEPQRAASPYVDVLDAYADRWVRRARTPADDRLDEWRRTGATLPPRRSPLLPPAHLTAEHRR